MSRLQDTIPLDQFVSKETILFLVIKFHLTTIITFIKYWRQFLLESHGCVQGVLVGNRSCFVPLFWDKLFALVCKEYINTGDVCGLLFQLYFFLRTHIYTLNPRRVCLKEMFSFTNQRHKRAKHKFCHGLKLARFHVCGRTASELVPGVETVRFSVASLGFLDTHQSGGTGELIGRAFCQKTRETNRLNTSTTN